MASRAPVEEPEVALERNNNARLPADAEANQ
jgi:hypothetical protein